jgi:pyruvate,orthophosphate dikinase
MVFSSAAAQASAARGEPCILVRRETAPEDIRGMHSAVAVLTERGGMTSHAAVIARGLGLPCVVGASDCGWIPSDKKLTAADGRIFREGDLITLDGTKGEVLAGAAEMLPPALDDSFRTLLAGPTRCATSACAPMPTRPPMPPPRASSRRRASACAGPSTCSSTKTAWW